MTIGSHPQPSPGFLIWITGLAGSGKTTLGRALHARLAEKDISSVVLDGDELREMTGGVFGYDAESRRKCAEFYSRLCQTLTRQGVNVICCTISMFESVRESNRNSNVNYFEVFLNAPMAVLKTRNQKKLYDQDQEGKAVVGIDVRHELPACADIVFEALNDETVERMTVTIAQRLLERGIK